jgi:hypothetical protein|tara:strand:+ start:242 stop:946 length:705 start_codon:yes stop_codon:yes gene_type:complete
MSEDSELETYLSISPNKFGIYLLDTKKNLNLYKEETNFEYNSENIDLVYLNKFLEENIFKIEKLNGNFIENIILIVKSLDVINLEIGIKKKNYENSVNKKYLVNAITEVKDLVKEAYQDRKIIHIIIKNLQIKDKDFLSIQKNFDSKDIGLEISFISIHYNLISQLEKLLEKYQIKINRYLCGSYVGEFSRFYGAEFSTMANKIVKGFNKNEVELVKKDEENKGFFEKFFQLFS